MKFWTLGIAAFGIGIVPPRWRAEFAAGQIKTAYQYVNTEFSGRHISTLFRAIYSFVVVGFVDFFPKEFTIGRVVDDNKNRRLLNMLFGEEDWGFG